MNTEIEVKNSIWEKVQAKLQRDRETREELLGVIKDAKSKAHIDQDSMGTIKRVMQVPELRARY